MKKSDRLKMALCMAMIAYDIVIVAMLICGFEMSSTFNWIHNTICISFVFVILLWNYIDVVIKNKKLREENINLLGECIDNRYYKERAERFETQVKELEKTVKNQNISIGMYKKNSKQNRKQIKSLQADKDAEVVDEK